jgi:hypothetical protein
MVVRAQAGTNSLGMGGALCLEVTVQITTGLI